MSNGEDNLLLKPALIFEKIGLSSGMRVADLGCGRTGHLVFPAAKKVGDLGLVYAVDILKEVLLGIKSQAKLEGCDNVQTVWSNIELPGKTPIPEKSLDACFLINVFYLLKDKLSALRESFRFLKEGGRAVVIDWTKKIGTVGPDEKMLIRPEILIELGRQAGLVLEDQFAMSDYNYCLIFKR